MTPDGTMLQPLSGSACSTDYVEIPGMSIFQLDGVQIMDFVIFPQHHVIIFSQFFLFPIF